MPKNYEKMAKNRLYGKHYKLKTDIDLHVKKNDADFIKPLATKFEMEILYILN